MFMAAAGQLQITPDEIGQPDTLANIVQDVLRNGHGSAVRLAMRLIDWEIDHLEATAGAMHAVADRNRKVVLSRDRCDSVGKDDHGPPLGLPVRHDLTVVLCGILGKGQNLALKASAVTL